MRSEPPRTTSTNSLSQPALGVQRDPVLLTYDA
jgi:hypothetical protein